MRSEILWCSDCVRLYLPFNKRPAGLNGPVGHEIYNFGRPCLGHHYCILTLSDLCMGVVKKIFKEVMHVNYMTYMVTPYHKNPCPGGHESYNFGRPFLGHHYYILSLSDICMRVEKKFLQKNKGLKGHDGIKRRKYRLEAEFSGKSSKIGKGLSDMDTSYKTLRFNYIYYLLLLKSTQKLLTAPEKKFGLC